MSTLDDKWTLMTADEFGKTLADANKVIELVEALGVSPFSCALAATSIIRGVVEATEGDLEWWIDLIRKGPNSITAVPVPKGVTWAKGPGGNH